MGWGTLRPEPENIKDRAKKRKKKEEKEKVKKVDRQKKHKYYEKHKLRHDVDRQQQVEDEKRILKKISDATDQAAKAAVFDDSSKPQPGDMNMVYEHIQAHQGISYVDMLSIWDEELGLMANIGNDRLDVALSFLRSQSLIVHKPDDDGPQGHWGYYTPDYLLQLTRENSEQDTCQQDVSTMSFNGGGD